VESIKLKPTWSNNGCGKDSIAKNLDHFLIHHNIIESVGMFRSWVGQTHAFDYFPIFSKLDFLDERLSSSFKFNSSWINLEEFQSLFKINWHQFHRGDDSSPSHHFVSNLKKLKGLVSTWAIERRRSKDKSLRTFEEELDSIYESLQFFKGGL
jgi:hypothetical protein